MLVETLLSDSSRGGTRSSFKIFYPGGVDKVDKEDKEDERIVVLQSPMPIDPGSKSVSNS